METVSGDLLTQLRKVPILSSLKDEELHCLDGVREIHVDTGEAIARQGEMAHFFWILLEGELRVHSVLPDGKDMTMATIESGNAFGELPLLTNIPNIANIEAPVQAGCCSSMKTSSGVS